MQLNYMKKALGHVACAALLGALGALASAPTLAATLSAVPSAPLAAGGTVDIDIRIDDIADLYAYEYSFRFDPTVLQFAGYADGGFLATGGNALVDGGTPDNATGVVWFAYGSLFGAVPGVTGSGSLARYTFNVIGGGSSSVGFSDVLFLDTNLADLPVQFAPQVLAAVPEPSAYLTFCAGLAMLAALRRRRQAPGGCGKQPTTGP